MSKYFKVENTIFFTASSLSAVAYYNDIKHQIVVNVGEDAILTLAFLKKTTKYKYIFYMSHIPHTHIKHF